MEKSENIFITDKYDDVYEILKVIDIHSTVYSTSGLEALAFGKPNIFIDTGKTSIKEIIDVVDNQTSFMVASPQQFIERINYIISNYKSISKDTIKASEMFFKPNAKENIEKFLKIIGINTKND
jgi:glycosyltransferase involved in cell wall biosynthesis